MVGFSGGSVVKKIQLPVQEMQVWSLIQKIPHAVEQLSLGTTTIVL